MNSNKFEIKYGDKGGMGRLIQMKNNLSPQKEIAEHFGVTQERVRQWIWEFFGIKYDPRLDRRRIVLREMLNYAINNSFEEFSNKYKGKKYYHSALLEIKKQKIYDTK